MVTYFWYDISVMVIFFKILYPLEINTETYAEEIRCLRFASKQFREDIDETRYPGIVNY